MTTMTRKPIALLFVCLMMVNIAVADDTAPELNATTPADFVEHSCVNPNASLRSPKNWRMGNLTSPNCQLLLMADKPGASVNLVIVPAKPGETPDVIAKTVPDSLKMRFADFELIKADVVKLGGQPAARLMYRATVKDDIKLEFCQFFINKNSKDFILTCTAKAEVFDAELPVFEEVAVSMRVP